MTPLPAVRRLAFIRRHFILACVAVFALGWIVARACIQSVVIDEADSYLIFAASTWPNAAFHPAAGNHVLNTVLIRLVTGLFGLNELTLRTPAILGAAVYIASAFYLCVLMTPRRLLQLLLFTCLVYNPFVLDYLVAARGYSLALGFLLAAIASVAHAIVARAADRRGGLGLCAAASVFLALSFTANFSFAVVDGIALLLFFLWVAWRRGKGFARLAAATFMPGFAVVALVCGQTLWNWPKGQLYFGATSLGEMWDGVVLASVDELPAAIEHHIHSVPMVGVRRALALLALIVTLTLLASLMFQRSRRRNLEAAKLVTLTGFCTVLFVSTLFVHWLAFHTLGLPLPKNRTALFFVPLFMLVLGGAVAIRSQMAGRDPLRACGTAMLIILALYFVACMRLGYFKEWHYNADTKHVYWILNDLNRRCGVNDFVIEWRYVGSLNFYRTYFANNAIPEFALPGAGGLYRTDGGAYVLYYPDAKGFIQQQHLDVPYLNERTGSVVAARPCAAR